jgi:hypothetical protein
VVFVIVTFFSAHMLWLHHRSSTTFVITPAMDGAIRRSSLFYLFLI